MKMFETINTLFVLGDEEELDKFESSSTLFLRLHEVKHERTTRSGILHISESLFDSIKGQVEVEAERWPKLIFRLGYMNRDRTVIGFARFEEGRCEEYREQSINRNSTSEEVKIYNDFADEYFLKYNLQSTGAK